MTAAERLRELIDNGHERDLIELLLGCADEIVAVLESAQPRYERCEHMKNAIGALSRAILQQLGKEEG